MDDTAMTSKKQALSDSYLDEMSDVLRVLAHAYRLRIVEYLDLNGAAPVFRIAEALGGSQGSVSQHLTKMRTAKLLNAERRGKEVWYDIENPASLTILNCMRNRIK